MLLVVAAGLAGTRVLWRGKVLRIRVGRTLEPGGSRGDHLAALRDAILEAMPPYEEVPGARPWPWLTHSLQCPR